MDKNRKKEIKENFIKFLKELSIKIVTLGMNKIGKK